MSGSKNNYLVLLISILFFYSSCSHRYYYVPNESSTLALKEKKDLKVSMGIGGIEGGGSNFNLQAGYSPYKHLGIQTSIFSVSKPVKNASNFGHGYTGSLAIGAYHFMPLNLKNKDNSESFNINTQLGILLDAYIGYERGNIETYSRPLSYSKFDFQKYFLQSGIYLQQGNFGFNFSVKFSQLDFLSGKLYQTADDFILEEVNFIKNNNPFNTVESTFGFHFGKEALKAFFSCTILHTDDILTSKFSVRSTRFGIVMDINEFAEIIRNR